MKVYDRQAALAYCEKWALNRNPAFYNFDKIGGDCTNFVSQCLYAGASIMNYTPDTGWFYRSISSRSAAWTGVEYLYRFLTTNKGSGPYGTGYHLEPSDDCSCLTQPGDIIQLSFNGYTFGHSLFVMSVEPQILISQHSDDLLNFPLSKKNYQKARLIHIEGVRG